jgi:hypothetical protein
MKTVVALSLVVIVTFAICLITLESDQKATTIRESEDGRADIAVWRPNGGIWHMVQSSNGYKAFDFGASTDHPIPKHQFTP